MRGLRAIGLDTVVLRNERMKVSGVRIGWGHEGDGLTRGTIFRHRIEDRDVWFFVANENDAVQRWHAEGAFFEVDELLLIKQHYRGGTFVDVGANVGNHSLYAALFCDAERIVAFEPDPRSRSILEYNLRLNMVRDRVDLRAVGLADKAGQATISRDVALNLGATRLARSDGGTLTLERGDIALAGEKVAFIKIDVEGQEIGVLNGLRGTLGRDRPVIFVEVDNQNRRPFFELVRKLGYSVANEAPSADYANFLLLPEAPAA